MDILYFIVFFILLVFSAFFSSAETSILSLDINKLNIKAAQGQRKAIIIKQLLEKPDEFFSTILIGNNFVNIAAASISTLLFTKWLIFNEKLVLVISSFVTTTIILLFAEIIPKLFAFRYSEVIALFYAYPLIFFKYLFYPFVKTATYISKLFIKPLEKSLDKKEMTFEEIKHFLSNQIRLFKKYPESLKMINEIIDISQKNIRSIMTPRPEIIALPEDENFNKIFDIIQLKNIGKIPIYKNNLDNVTGIINIRNIRIQLLNQKKHFTLKQVAEKPLFLSEYSSLNYALKEFNRHNTSIAIIIDEYGVTIGLITLSDIFREILGEIKTEDIPIKKIGRNTFLIEGSASIEDIKTQLNIELPEKKDYTSISGMFIYHFGKFPKPKNKLLINNHLFIVKTMEQRKIKDLVILPNFTLPKL